MNNDRMDFFTNISLNRFDDIDIVANTSSVFLPSYKNSFNDLYIANFDKDTVNDFDRFLFKREDINELKMHKTAMNMPSLDNIWNVIAGPIQTKDSFKKSKLEFKNCTLINDVNLKPTNIEALNSSIDKNVDFDTKPSKALKIKTVHVNPSKKSKPSKQEQSKTHSKCMCTNSKCLRLYCACFANGATCGLDCQCIGCFNTDSSAEIRDQIIQETLQKNPNAFKSKYKRHVEKGQVVHVRGCNCTKTGCIKEYCECFKMGTGCSPLCRCVNCKNDKVEMKPEEVKDYFVKATRKRKKTKFFEEHFGTGKKQVDNKENVLSKD